MVGELQTAKADSYTSPRIKALHELQGLVKNGRYVSTKNWYDPSIAMSVPIPCMHHKAAANSIAGLSVHVFSHLLRHSTVPPA